MMAGLDGIQNKITRAIRLTRTCTICRRKRQADPDPCAPAWKALAALDADREFLTRGGVFSNDFISIRLKMDEVNKTRMTAHPVEFQMYYSL